MGAGKACSVVHIENSYASGEKKRPRGPRPVLRAEPIFSLGPVLQRPLFDLKTQATTYYLHYHVQTLNDDSNISKSLLDDFLSIRTSRAECPILDLAVSCMALAVFSRTQQHPPAAIEASTKYQQLLQSAQVAIRSLDQGNIDTCLLAIFFMSRYEDAVHRPGHANVKTPITSTFQSFSHHDGALAILEAWTKYLSRTHPATDVIKHTRRSLIKSALLRTLAVPDWMLKGTLFGEHGLEHEYDCIVVRIANIRHRLSTVLVEETGLRSPHEINSTAEMLHEEARDIDRTLQDWTTHFPSTWCYRRHLLPNPHPSPTRDFYSPIVYSYSSPAYAAVWNQYYAMRMLINSTRLRILKLSLPDSGYLAAQQRLECLAHMQIMASDLASSVPFCLQRFRVTDGSNSSYHPNSVVLTTNEDIKPYLASLLAWPLTIASSLASLDIKQKTWFQSELAHVGRTVGISVLESAEADQWMEL
ncbi:hypothetical protein MMC19_000213 [Ptychographa xylographoides]|nr:hypothetical protein [Ptychographa xylographoides]